MRPSNAQIAKTGMTTSVIASAGKLNDEQFDYFIELMKDEETLLKDIDIQPMKSEVLKLESLEFATRVTRVATEGQAFSGAEIAGMTASKVELQATKKLRAETSLTYELREENLARGKLDDDVIKKLAKQFKLDLQDLVVLGDSSLNSSSEPLLHAFDGLIVQATTNLTDYTPNPQSVTDNAFFETFISIPSKYRTNKGDMRIYCDSDCEAAYNKYLSGRETSVGDTRMIEGTQRTFWSGILLYPLSSMPSSKFLITNRHNIVVGIFRDITTYTWDYPREEVVYYGLTARVDVKYREESAVGKFLGLSPAAGITTI